MINVVRAERSRGKTLYAARWWLTSPTGRVVVVASRRRKMFFVKTIHRILEAENLVLPIEEFARRKVSWLDHIVAVGDIPLVSKFLFHPAQPKEVMFDEFDECIEMMLGGPVRLAGGTTSAEWAVTNVPDGQNNSGD